MKKLKKMLLWLFLLTKRVYKRPTFLAILVLIPLLVFGYTLAVQEDSGMISVALAGDSDAFTDRVFTELENSGQLLRYVRCSSAAEAELLVSTGKVDAAWIFPEDLEGAITTFTRDPSAENAFVRVIQREENVALMLSRERLGGVIYPYISRVYYLDFMRQNYPALSELPDEKLMEYYDGTDMGGTLFEYDSAKEDIIQPVHYLMSPVRGLLAVVIVLGGMATAMYWIKDAKNGTFQWLPARYQNLPELGSQLVTGVNLCIVSLVALSAGGLAEGLLKEIGALLLYALVVAVFCMVLRRILGSQRALGTALPLLIVVMLVVCPVFFDLAGLRTYQLLLPPTYYINSIYNSAYMLYGLLYVLAGGLICLVWDAIAMRYAPYKRRKRCI